MAGAATEPAPGAAAGAAARRRVLFVTSNGTGLGHLTRSMAIARRLDDELEPLFLTLSGAAPVVRGMGFAVEYVASYATPGSGNDWRWSRRLRARLRAALDEADPAVLVFDGTHPYEALLGAFRGRPRTLAVWCRRALWKRGSSRVPLGRGGAFDAVLEPGELAGAEDRGPTVPLRERARCVAPIVLLDRPELLDRAAAEAELGLQPGRTNVLVALGQGAEVREATDRCLRLLAGREDVQVAALSSALAGLGEVPAGVVRLEATYPMSRYFAAFDAAVAAAGYNAYHELLHLGVPSLFVPMHRETDDQPARARWAAAAGVGLGTAGPADPALEELLERLLEPAARETMAARLDELDPANGAAEAAAWLGELVRGERRAGAVAGAAAGARDSAARAFARRWGTFIASLPRTALRLGRQTLTEPRPRALVLAVGIEPARFADSLRAALAEAGERPERVLVVTDSLDFVALRAAGVGFEHVPAAGERQPELAGVPYREFLRERLRLITAERPRPRRTVVAPGGAPLP